LLVSLIEASPVGARQARRAGSRGAGGYLGYPGGGEGRHGAVHSLALCTAEISTGGRGISANLGAPPPGPLGPGFTFCGVAACF
jgi:hypothetical protein